MVLTPTGIVMYGHLSIAAWLGASLPCCFKRTLVKRYGDHCRERHQADVLAGAIIGVVRVCQIIPSGNRQIVV